MRDAINKCILLRRTELRLARTGGSRNPALTVDLSFSSITGTILHEPPASQL